MVALTSSPASATGCENGWDDAYDANGKWTRGRLHGYVTSTATPARTPNRATLPPCACRWTSTAARRRIPWTGRVAALFRNRGTRTAPVLGSGELVQAEGAPLRMNLCMIQPRVVLFMAPRRPAVAAHQRGRRRRRTGREHSAPPTGAPFSRAQVPGTGRPLFEDRRSGPARRCGLEQRRETPT